MTRSLSETAKFCALLALVAAGALLSGPAGLRPAPQSAEATSLSEIKKLLASDAEAGDTFGISVAVSGDTAVVGARDEAAYVFQHDQGGADNWGEVTKLTTSDAQAGDTFGISVAVSGDTTVVGARGENAAAGAAYVFQRNQGGADNWGEVKKLTASDAQARDQFGDSVAVSGDTIVVGAVGEDTAGNSAGAAYVFQRDQGGADNWGQVTKLTASDAGSGDSFGWSMAVSGDTAVVGAWLADSGGTAYVFQRDQGGADNWGEVKKLTASDTEFGDRFGYRVAVSGDTAVVGAQNEDTGAINAGAAYVFQRNQGGGANWGETKKLTASDAESGDRFGISVAVSGDIAIVGATGEDAGGSLAGAAYVFQQPASGAATPTPTSPGPVTPAPTSPAPATATPTPPASDTATPTSPAPDTATPVPATATPTSLPGDVGCDGTVNAIDAALILQFSAGLIDSLACQQNADVSGDGRIDAIDASLILQFTADLLPSL